MSTQAGRASGGDDRSSADLAGLMIDVARGDERAFEALYDHVAASVYGLVHRVVRDVAQSEEVAQEVLVEVWRTAARYDPRRGSAMSWILTLAHRRAVDRVRRAQASADREARANSSYPSYDSVSEVVENRMQAERVRRCLDTLTEIQNDCVQLAYYQGYTYREVAKVLAIPLGTAKTRMRDALIRLRDCLGVRW